MNGHSLKLLLQTTCMILCSWVAAASAQDISGIWRGELLQGPNGCYPKYFIELQLQLHDKEIQGITYDYYDTTKFVKLNFKGRLNTVSKRMVLIENKVIEFKIPGNCVPCIKTYDLTWKKQDNQEELTGTWKGSKMGSNESCPPGTLFLKRVSASAFKNEELLQDKQLAEIQKNLPPIFRKTELIQTIIVDAPSLKVQLYDNGQIDGDTISVFLNQQLIVYKKALTEKAITLEIPVHESKDYEMVMFAESLGTIPPNTALMVVSSGTKKYEIYLSSSEQKSAAVRFRYEK